MTTATANLCDCCQKNESIGASTRDKLLHRSGVACLPVGPISIAWCQECLEAGIVPYWYVTTNTAMLGGIDNAADWWKDIVARTLKHFNITNEKFEHDTDAKKTSIAIENRSQVYDNSNSARIQCSL